MCQEDVSNIATIFNNGTSMIDFLSIMKCFRNAPDSVNPQETPLGRAMGF